MVSEAIFPHLEEFSPEVVDELAQILPKLAAGGSTIKVLFRPTGSHDPKGFFFVASHPPVSSEILKDAHKRVVGGELLSRISDSCDYRRSLKLDFVGTEGAPQILTYLGSRVAPNGCWAVLTSLDRNLLLNFSPQQSYWQRPELQIATVIYLLMVVLVLSIFAGAWMNLRRFSHVAQLIRRGNGRNMTFRQRNRIPELDGVAAEFDAFVSAQLRSEELIRQAAEENAHALKAPLAGISQSLEPVRQAIREDDDSANRGLDLIVQSIDRLDGQISAARRIEEATAELMNQQFSDIDVVSFLPVLVDDYRTRAEDRDVSIHVSVQPELTVKGNENLIETALENVMENALDFAPAGTVILVSAFAEGDMVHIRVDDDGPGIEDEYQERIFGRHFTTRQADGVDGNFGIGLWIVRRNVEMLGGNVSGQNRADGGFRLEIQLPIK